MNFSIILERERAEKNLKREKTEFMNNHFFRLCIEAPEEENKKKNRILKNCIKKVNLPNANKRGQHLPKSLSNNILCSSEFGKTFQPNYNININMTNYIFSNPGQGSQSSNITGIIDNLSGNIINSITNSNLPLPKKFTVKNWSAQKISETVGKFIIYFFSY